MQRLPGISRRTFIRLCTAVAAGVGAAPQVLAAENATEHGYARVRLVDHYDTPLRADDLKVGENYVFFYPFLATPCLLLNLGRAAEPGPMLRTEDGRQYRWPGGAGPDRTIVAFSAICAHRMSYPAPSVSFINYRHKPVDFVGEDDQVHHRGQVIYCCSERSVYDPLDGARVLGGPAPQPLAAIILDYVAAEHALYARGTYGGEMFHRFFKEFSFRLALEHGTDGVAAPVTGTSRVIPLADYSRTEILC